MILTYLKLFWKDILLVCGGLLIFQKVLKELFGVSMLGRKLYKGAPGFWKRMIQTASFRKQMVDEVSKIRLELTSNGGGSLKDAVKRIEAKSDIHTQMFKELSNKVEFNNLRLDLQDLRNGDMIFRMGADGAITFISDSYCERFHVHPKDMLGFAFENLLHEEDRERVIEKWKRAREKCSRFYDQHKIFDQLTSEFVECVVRGYPIVENEICVGFYGIVDELLSDNTNEHHEQL